MTLDLFETDAKKIIEKRIEEEVKKLGGVYITPFQLSQIAAHVTNELLEPPVAKAFADVTKEHGVRVNIRMIDYR